MTWQADTLKVQAGAAVGRELRTLLKPLVKPGGSSTHRADHRSGRFSLYVRSRGFLSRAWNHRTMAGGLVGCLTLLSWERSSRLGLSWANGVWPEGRPQVKRASPALVLA